MIVRAAVEAAAQKKAGPGKHASTKPEEGHIKAIAEAEEHLGGDSESDRVGDGAVAAGADLAEPVVVPDGGARGEGAAAGGGLQEDGQGVGNGANKEKQHMVEALIESELVGGESKFDLPEESSFEGLEQDASRCPLQYDRLEYEGIRNFEYRPYLMGERARPACTNCDKDHLWSYFCQYKSHGEVCPDYLKMELLTGWISRADQGAPGVKDMLTLTPCDLFPLIRGRTLWLLGDSQTLRFDKAMMCFMYEFWDLETRDLAPLHPHPPEDFQGWCSHMAQDTRICFIRSNTGTDMADKALTSLPLLGAKPSDIMVLNFAVWSNDMGQYASQVAYFAQRYKKIKGGLPVALWRDSPVQHFQTPTGDYVYPVPGDECGAIPGVELHLDNTLHAVDPSNNSSKLVAEGGWRNKIALPVMRDLGIPIIHTWNQTVPMWQYHTDKDCTHVCHPSEYEYWVFELYRTLKMEFPELA